MHRQAPDVSTEFFRLHYVDSAMVTATNHGDYTRSHYDAERVNMERLLDAAMRISQGAGGIQTSSRYIRAAQLFTRLTIGTYTFVRLLPSNTLTRD